MQGPNSGLARLSSIFIWRILAMVSFQVSMAAVLPTLARPIRRRTGPDGHPCCALEPTQVAQDGKEFGEVAAPTLPHMDGFKVFVLGTAHSNMSRSTNFLPAA